MRIDTRPATSRWVSSFGNALAVLCLVYAVVLVGGLLTLAAPDQPIQNPWFTLLELLILAIAPVMVAFTVGIHSQVPFELKVFSLMAVVFMSMCAVVTCIVHFTVLTLSRQPAVIATAWAPLVFTFAWPSVVYALDILAWDFFFPIGTLFMALAIRGAWNQRVPRILLFGSSALSLLGLAGVPFANMNVRNIGIIGYAVLFPIAAVLLAANLKRERD